MDNDLLNKYKQEMLKMYRSVNSATPEPVRTTAPTPPENTTPPPQNTVTGNLIGIVTSIRGLYPVKNAKVSIFTGEYENMSVIDTDLTDQSGRTKIFVLPTPERSISLEKENASLPYATYNMVIEADGYIKNIHLNIPVFGGVTSLQQSNLLLEETAGEDKSPQIFDEAQKYDL